MSERFGIERCQWQNLSDENSIQWHCHTHGYGIDEDPQGGLCGCAQDQTRAGLAGREEVLPILQDLIAELRDAHYNDQCGCGCEQWYECKPCLHVGLCPSQEAAVRAEQRLREVSDE